MFRLFGLLLVGLVLSGLSASKTFAEVIICERTSNDTSGWKNREAFESVWPKEFSLPQEEFIEAGVGSRAMLWVKDYGGGWILFVACTGCTSGGTTVQCLPTRCHVH